MKATIPAVTAAEYPSSDLFGLDVVDPDGQVVGTVDSVVRTYRGGTKAVVRLRSGAVKAAFADLDRAVIHGDQVLLNNPLQLGCDGAERHDDHPPFVWPLRAPRTA